MSDAPRSGLNVLTKRQFFSLTLLALVLVLAIAYFMGAFSFLFPNRISADEDNTSPIKPLPVNVMTVKFVPSITQSRKYTGTIRARQRSDLGFEVSGKIKNIFVDEGSVVKPNQILAELDTETLIAQKGAILARLAQANFLLQELNAGPRMETIRAARAAVVAAESEHKNATLNLDRRRRIRDSLSSEEFDQALFAEKSAKANLESAQERQLELESGTRKEQVDAQMSAVKQLEASIKEIEVAISKTQLRAPFEGVVTRRYLDPGSIAPASVRVVKLVEQQHLEAWIGLPVSIAADIEPGSEHQIMVDGNMFNVAVTAKIQELDPATHTQAVLFKLGPTASSKIVSGQICEIAISSSVDSSGCWIPTSALAKGVRGLWSVMVMVKDPTGVGYRIDKRGIEIVKTDSHRVLVQGTIEDGDQIVVNGTHRIANGQLVVPLELSTLNSPTSK